MRVRARVEFRGTVAVEATVPDGSTDDDIVEAIGDAADKLSDTLVGYHMELVDSFDTRSTIERLMHR